MRTEAMARRVMLPYAVAVLALLAAFGSRVLLMPILGDGSPFLLLAAAVMVSAWYGGIGPGLVATGVAGLSAAYWVLPPFHSFHIAEQSDRTRLLLFLAEGLLITLLGGQLKHARHRAEAQGHQLRTLLSMSRTLSAVQPMQAALDDIAAVCGQLFDSDAVSVRLAEDDVVVVRAVWGDRDRARLNLRLKFGEGLSGTVAATGEPLMVRDVVNYPGLRAAHREALRQLGHRAWLGVPIKFDGRVIGVLSIRTRRPGFSPADVELATAFADGAAFAIRNAEVFAREQAARAEAEAAREKYQSLFDGVPVGILRATMAGEILDVNPAMVAILGYPNRETLLAAPITALWADPAGRADWLARILPTGVLRDFEFEFRRWDGTPVWLRNTAQAIRDARGEIVYFDGVLEDITDQRATADALQASEQQLRQAQKMEAVGMLAGGIAHDFNNLLTVMLGRVELLQHHLPRDARTQHAVEVLRTTADRAAALVRQLLAFSRRQTLDPVVLDLNTVVGEFVEIVRRLIGEEIELETAFADDRVTTRADRSQLEQVLMNLVVNARDAMPTGGRLLLETGGAALDQTFISAHPGAAAGAHVFLRVRDTGVGMDRMTLERLFEPFFTTKERGRGSGLGLSTVYGIVKQHDGYIDVVSAPGHGTTITVYLGRSDDEPIEPTRMPEALPAGRAQATILLVEDDEEVRAVAAETLRAMGYIVLESADGAAGLRLAEHHAGPIDLLLTDVRMPHLSGPELAERLREQRPDIRCLYMSGYAADVIERRGRTGPGDVVVRKPFTLATFTQRVRAVLDG